MNLIKLFLFLTISVLFNGCVSSSNTSNLTATPQENVTVGKVQREIKVGMSGADVAEVLGSPNIVTSDGDNKEVWIYDKISSSVSTSSSGGYATLILIGGSSYTSNTTSTQSSLTIIIKFENRKVKKFSYRTSKF